MVRLKMIQGKVGYAEAGAYINVNDDVATELIKEGVAQIAEEADQAVSTPQVEEPAAPPTDVVAEAPAQEEAPQTVEVNATN